jgi:hypothetical protein
MFSGSLANQLLALSMGIVRAGVSVRGGTAGSVGVRVTMGSFSMGKPSFNIIVVEGISILSWSKESQYYRGRRNLAENQGFGEVFQRFMSDKSVIGHKRASPREPDYLTTGLRRIVKRLLWLALQRRNALFQSAHSLAE